MRHVLFTTCPSQIFFPLMEGAGYTLLRSGEVLEGIAGVLRVANSDGFSFTVISNLTEDEITQILLEAKLPQNNLVVADDLNDTQTLDYYKHGADLVLSVDVFSRDPVFLLGKWTRHGNNKGLIDSERLNVETQSPDIRSNIRSSDLQLLNRLISVSPAIIYSTQTHPPYQVKYMSENLKTITGYDPSVFLGNAQFWNQIVHPSDRERVLAQLGNLNLLGRIEMEYRMRFADGEYHCIHEGIVVVDGAGEKNNEAFGYFVDMTDQKRSEWELQRNQNMYRTLAEASRDLIFVVNEKFQIEYLNSYALNALEFTSDITENISSDLISILVKREVLSEVFAGGEPLYREYELDIHNSRRWVGTWLVPIHFEGSISSVMGVARDITSKKESEIELHNALDKERKLNELRSQFLSMTSHEFKTPLSTILSSSELLEHYGDRWEKTRIEEHIHRIQNAAKRMDSMLSDMLDVSRVNDGKTQLEYREINVDQYCRSILNELMTSDNKRHDIQYKFLGYSQIVIDPELLRKILSNLVSNSIKYSPPGSKIGITIQHDEGSLWLTVIDQGAGISDNDRPVLFDPFFRGKNVLEIPGTGLGLPIVKKSVELLGGSIDYQSRLGKGTQFFVKIPVHTIQ